MSDLFTRTFWRDTLERTVSSAAQGFLVGGGLAGIAATTDQVSLHGFPWEAALAGAGGMAVLTVAKCLAAVKAGNWGTASFTRAVEPADAGTEL
ncbi:hypothetical protein [Mycolicibacterium goodii]|uniref:hypothetical protein n=1 Tax=Mycolicibacterium goodii TaxID=134601 RepID=UPI001BDD4360|nr:hypothetical protein [Mycolicibacterium goodii]MBU8830814.1 hypothetical protein [Mycolicibacterium goodii]